jgi:hypothetical protein
VLEKNEILSFAGKWMELENIIVSEVSQAQKAKDCMFSSMWEDRPNASNIMKNRSHPRGGHIQEREGKRRKLRRHSYG